MGPLQREEEGPRRKVPSYSPSSVASAREEGRREDGGGGGGGGGGRCINEDACQPGKAKGGAGGPKPAFFALSHRGKEEGEGLEGGRRKKDERGGQGTLIITSGSY